MLLGLIHDIFSLLGKRDRKKFYLLILLLFFGGLVSLLGLSAIVPFVMALVSPNKNWLIEVFHGVNKQTLFFGSIVFIIFAFWLKNIVSFYFLRIQAKILFGFSCHFSERLFKSYVNASYVWHLRKNTAELVRNVINESSVLANGILGPLGSLLTELVTALFIFMVLLYIDVKFTLLVSIFLIGFMWIFVRITRQEAHKYSLERAASWTAMTQSVLQGLGGIKETKIYELEPYFIESFDRNMQRAASAGAFSNIYSQASRFVLEGVAVTVVMVSVGFLLYFHYSTQEVLSLLSVFGVASMQLLPSINRLMVAFASIKYSYPAFLVVSSELRKLEKRIPQEHHAASPPLVFKREISLDGVSFAYPTGRQVLNNISFSILKGQWVAFVGFSGAGKTTLADVILGLLKLDHGKILIDDVPLTEGNLSIWHQHLGYIPQSIFLYDCSIKENVAFGVDLDQVNEEKIWEALDMASLKEFVSSLPNGIDTQIGENGIRLSGGQRQRLGIARALFRDPKVLIMDEATSSLDNQTENEVTEAIQKAIKNRTTITIAHRLSTIKNCDVIYVIDKGMLVAQGNYQHLIKECDFFKRLVQLDTQHTEMV